jgi:hypothetical protein
MERWPQEYYHKMPAAKRENYGKDTVERLKKLWQTLEPQLPVTVNGAEGAVFWNVREVSGARYVSVVNNLRQAGTYTEWTGKPEFKPYGKAQAATVRIKTPAESAIYEFTEGRRLTPQRDGEFAVVTLALPPHGGRLLCVYPRAIERVRAEIAGKTEQGLPARLQVRIEDRKGKPVPGRQLVDVRIVDAGNARQDARYYAATDGALAVPFFPALNDAPGRWAVTVTDRASGRSVVLRPKVRPAKAP